MKWLFFILMVFGAINVSAQITLDTVSVYPYSNQATVMITDSAGSIIVGGNAGDLPTLTKFNPDTGLAWTYSYPVAEGDKGQVLALTVDNSGNIYSYLHSEIANHWVQKFSPNGDTIRILDSLQGIYISSIRSFGHIEVNNEEVQLLTETDLVSEVVTYVFDTALSVLIDSSTYQIQSAVSCCYEPVLSSPGELIFNGIENDVQGVYQIENNQINHHPFIGHQFDDIDYSILPKWNNQYFVYSNNDVLTGENDTFSVYNPEFVVFDTNWVALKSNQPFYDTVNNGNSIVRPIIRDALLHPEYGIIICGEYYSGTSVNPVLAQFIAQLDPTSLKIVNSFVQENNRFFTHLTQFEDQVYALDRPRGYPSGMNLLKLNLDKVVGLAEVSTKSKGFQVVIYPNPTTGSIQIESETAIEKVEVYDLSGRVVLQSNNPTSQVFQLEKPGVYLVQVFTSKGVETQKIVVAD